MKTKLTYLYIKNGLATINIVLKKILMKIVIKFYKFQTKVSKKPLLQMIDDMSRSYTIWC